MVATVQPSSSAMIGVDPRATREAPRSAGDSVKPQAPLDPVSKTAENAAAPWRVSRENVRAALADLDLSLAAARAALDALGTSGGDAAAGAIADAAVAGGASLLAGGTLRVQTETDAPAFEIAGFELKSLAQAGDSAGLEAGLDRLRAAAQRLEAHDGFLAALEESVAVGVRGDLDADGARLLALQVRQGLGQSAGAIANMQPDSVLGLFRG